MTAKGTKQINWSPDKVARLIHLREVEKLKWEAIGEAMGASAATCCNRYNYRVHNPNRTIRERAARVRDVGLPEALPPAESKRKIWTTQRLELIVKLRDVDHLAWSDIGERFRVSGRLACKRYHTYKSGLRVAEKQKQRIESRQLPPAPKPAAVAPPAILPTVTPSPDKRPRYFHTPDMDVIARIERQGLTAGFLGDPPPGRSALDKRGQQT